MRILRIPRHVEQRAIGNLKENIQLCFICNQVNYHPKKQSYTVCLSAFIIKTSSPVIRRLMKYFQLVMESFWEQNFDECTFQNLMNFQRTPSMFSTKYLSPLALYAAPRQLKDDHLVLNDLLCPDSTTYCTARAKLI